MGKYLRISNRGLCPRRMLTVLGATSKREHFDDPALGGWFGSGAKFAPIAAINLGIDVHFLSKDSKGDYHIKYEVGVSDEDGRPMRLLYHRYADGTVVPTHFSLDACMNWTKPIGDDQMRSFRVLREYLRNAKDEQPDGPLLAFIDFVEPPADGCTAVYLTLTEEMMRMLANPLRYFKYLSPAKPHASVDGIGEVYAKSEPGVTRLFSLGTLAKCTSSEAESTVFDYSLDDKELMSEERTFENMGDVYQELAHLLAGLDRQPLIMAIIAAIIDGKARMEAHAMGFLSSSDDFPAQDEWLAAWHNLHQTTAVLSSSPFADGYVEHTGAAKVVEIKNDYVKRFLKRCGVKEAYELVPGAKPGGWRTVARNDVEKEMLDLLLPAVYEHFPQARDIPVSIFEPLTEAKKKDFGFAWFQKGTGWTIHLQRNKAFVSMEELAATIGHEIAHCLSGAVDATYKFEEQLTREVGKLILAAHPFLAAYVVPLPAASAEEPPPLPPVPPPPKKDRIADLRERLGMPKKK